MKLAYVAKEDLNDIKLWAGIPYHMIQSFTKDAGLQIETIDQLTDPPLNFGIYAKRLLFNKLFKYRFGIYRYEREDILVYNYARQIEDRIKKSNADVIFATTPFHIAALRTELPIVCWTDATFDLLRQGYEGYTGLSKASMQQWDKTEKKALENCSLLIYSSQWAADSAINHYGIDPSKIQVIPFGANIKHEQAPDEIERIIESRSKETCNLLFLGADWIRKGGEKSLEVVRSLNEMGVPAVLHIVGCNPPIPDQYKNFVRVKGFLKKDNTEGLNDFEKLLRESHFLLLPTKADCTPLAFAEANAHGIPVISTTVGGVPSMVTQDVNGTCMHEKTEPKKFAEYIIHNYSNNLNYRKLALSSYNEYRKKLNWKSASETFHNSLKKVVGNKDNYK